MPPAANILTFVHHVERILSAASQLHTKTIAVCRFEKIVLSNCWRIVTLKKH